MKKKLVLVGGGGHCRSCIDVIEQTNQYDIVGILDKGELVGQEILGYQIIGTDEQISQYVKNGHEFLVTVGQISAASLRKQLYFKLKECNARLATIFSPRSYVSRHASVGSGTIVMHDALINANATVGENCIINSKSLVEHDVSIESHCHISTGAVINGGVLVREGTFFGSSAVSKEGVSTDSNAFVKAGAIFVGKL